MKHADPYSELVSRFAHLSAVSDAASMLHWDWAAMMPNGGAGAREDQLAALKSVCHSIITDPVIGDLLDAVECEDRLDDWQAANVREMRRRWAHANALDEKLVVRLGRAGMRCETIWRQARLDADFGAVLPDFENLVGIVREAADAKAEKLGLDPYDALLDEYEPGGRSRDIDPVFKDIESFLPEFMREVTERQALEPPPVPAKGPFAIERQRRLGLDLMKALGFDFNHGRLDVSLHPFCGGVPDDIRITTRYDENDFAPALMGVLHETGHAMYERGLPREWRGQPVGEARGMSIHESQSLLIEMQVCRGKEFLNWAAPIIKSALGGEGDAWSAENLIRLNNRVKPGFIRVDADEVTYPAHVILRYRLERAMISGALLPADLPGAWNEGMEKILGITPPDDREGCLQDIHWFDGTFGYFPTYTLGAIAAAQIFAAAKRDDPGIVPAIGKGNFSPLMDWLGKKVHGQGSRLETPELIRQATGRPLDIADFKAHLKKRYMV